MASRRLSTRPRPPATASGRRPHATGLALSHATFYEVRPHLHADTYVNTVLIGPKAHSGLTAADHEPLLKLFVYGLGGAGVDAYLDYLRDPSSVPARLGDLDLPSLKRLCGRLRIKVMVLLLTTPAAAARPETWRWLGERFAARRELQGGGEEAVVASTHGPLDVLTGLSIRSRLDDAAVTSRSLAVQGPNCQSAIVAGAVSSGRWGMAHWRRQATRQMGKLFGKKPRASRPRTCRRPM